MLIGCVVLVLLYLLVRFYDTSVESYRLEQRAEVVRQEIARLESDNQALATQVARARTDEYVELIARERLNMIRPGDRPLVMLREQPPAAVSRTALAGAGGRLPSRNRCWRLP